MRFAAAALAAAVAVATPFAASADGITISHAIAEFGEPNHGPEFQHFDYANPDAPKGGRLTIGTFGSFDTLNTLPLSGEWPRSIGLLYDTLMVQPQDELSVYYGLIAESVEYPEDRSWIVFNLRPEARFHDGTPITAEDVAWTLEMIQEHARPFLKSFYENVTGWAIEGPRRIRVDVSTRDIMQPLVRLAATTIWPKHWWTSEGRDVTSSTLEPPLGSGPYRLVSLEPGRDLAYERIEDYWAADLPVRRGFYNFDRIVYNYYRDRVILFEAFKGQEYDFRREFTSRNWATGYDVEAVENGEMLREELPTIRFSGQQGFFMNTRRAPFDDIRVREALQHLYPFEWVNANLMFGLYNRTDSWFPNSPYGATGLPEGQELEILEQFRGRIPEAIFTEPFQLPTNSEPNINRSNLRAAVALMRDAGLEVVDGTMVDTATGEAVSFEILLRTPSLEPHTQPLVRNLERVGIEALIRIVDSAQFQRRYQDRDFDMIIFAYTFFPPPGTEMRSRFGSAAADVDGSANLIGIRDPVVDELIEMVVEAPDLETKQATARALDRILMRGYYTIPHWHNDTAWLAYWNRFGFPETHPTYDLAFPNGIAFQPTWWIDPEKDLMLTEAR